MIRQYICRSKKIYTSSSASVPQQYLRFSIMNSGSSSSGSRGSTNEQGYYHPNRSLSAGRLMAASQAGQGEAVDCECKKLGDSGGRRVLTSCLVGCSVQPTLRWTCLIWLKDLLPPRWVSGTRNIHELRGLTPFDTVLIVVQSLKQAQQGRLLLLWNQQPRRESEMILDLLPLRLRIDQSALASTMHRHLPSLNEHSNLNENQRHLIRRTFELNWVHIGTLGTQRRPTDMKRSNQMKERQARATKKKEKKSSSLIQECHTANPLLRSIARRTISMIWRLEMRWRGVLGFGGKARAGMRIG